MMKTKFISALMLMTITNSAVAAISQSEFQTRMDQIRKSHESFKKKAKNMGVVVQENIVVPSKPLTPEELEEQRNRPLFEVHATRKTLLAPAGQLFYGKILNRIIVGAEPVPAIIILDHSQNFFSGLRVLGKARPSGADGRLAIDFNRVVTKSGDTIPIQGYAHDKAGAFGLQAEVFSSKALAVGGALASSFVSGLASAGQTTVPNQFGFSQVDQTGRNAILQGVAKTAADQSKRLIDDATKEIPVLVVEADTPVAIYLEEEVRQ
jgi:hypothetical protein